MSDCVFCKLMGTDIVETCADGVVSFTPLNPVTSGHKLFVHEQHTTDAAHDPIVTGKVFEQAAYHGKTHGESFNLITSKGSEATQTVFHLHVHYVPRIKDDGLHLPWTNQKK